jgi:hypothetical protein
MMSDFIPGIAEKARYRKYRASSYEVHSILDKPKQTELEATILSWIIANSTVEENIEEAVKAIAGMPSTHFDVLQKAMAECRAVSALCKRFTRLFTFSPGLPVTAADANQAAAYLYALHAVVGIDRDSLPHEDGRHNPCFELWQPAGPLHRWDNLEPCLQALAFCIRSEILLAADNDDHDENWEETKRNLKSMCQTGSNQNLQKILMDVAIRSVASKRKHLQRIGTIVFSSVVKIGKSMGQFGSFDHAGGDKITVSSGFKVSLKEIVTSLQTMLQNDDTDIRDAALLCLIKLAYFGKS